jgi:hypothetical protein
MATCQVILLYLRPMCSSNQVARYPAVPNLELLLDTYAAFHAFWWEHPSLGVDVGLHIFWQDHPTLPIKVGSFLLQAFLDWACITIPNP